MSPSPSLVFPYRKVARGGEGHDFACPRWGEGYRVKISLGTRKTVKESAICAANGAETKSAVPRAPLAGK